MLEMGKLQKKVKTIKTKKKKKRRGVKVGESLYSSCRSKTVTIRFLRYYHHDKKSILFRRAGRAHTSTDVWNTLESKIVHS